MDLGIKNKVAFVAASSKGLGKAVAIEFQNEGAHVIICGRNKETLNSAKEEIEQLGGNDVLAIPGDLSIATDRNNIIEQALDVYPTIDILVTNTGGPPAGKFETIAQEEWDIAYHQLLASAVSLVRGFLPGMKQQKWGRIISVTSQAVKQPVDNLILSNSVRASVVGLMKTLANELGEYNITVNNVMPGYTSTERLRHLMKVNPSLASAAEEVPLGRIGRPDEFAAAVAFLASQRASYISGVSLPVDGGWIKAIL